MKETKTRQGVQELFKKIEEERYEQCGTLSILKELCRRVKLTQEEKEQAFYDCIDPYDYLLDKGSYLEICGDTPGYKENLPTLQLANEFFRLCFIKDLENGPTAKTAGQKKNRKKQVKHKK